jgi:LysR family transcriptional regulator, hca operon transcriptional activator
MERTIMELRHLRYFIAVAEEGSFTLAAEKRLHTTQPSLGRQIRALEDEVGTKLMTRSVHGIELTAAGTVFLDHARLAVAQSEAGKEAARRAAQTPKPSLAVGFLSGYLLPDAMRDLRDKLPDVEVKLSSDYSPRLGDALMKGRLDAAFMRPEPHDGSLVYKRLRTEPLILVFPKGHRLAARKSIRLFEIRGEPFIKPARTAPALRAIVEESLKRAGLGIHADHEAHNFAHAFSVMASSRAVALMPAYAKDYLPSSVASRPIKGDAPRVDLVVGYNRANTSRVLKLFLERVGGLTSDKASRARGHQT